MRDLRAREVQRFDEVRVKDGKAVKKDADKKEKIQEGSKDNPPAIVNADVSSA